MTEDNDKLLSQEVLDSIAEKASTDIDSLPKDEFLRTYAEYGACHITWKDGSKTCISGSTFAQCDAISYRPDVEKTGFSPRRPCP